MRKKKTLSSTTELKEPVQTIELDTRLDYENVSDLQVVTAAQTKDTPDYENLEKVVQGQNDWGVTYTSTHICAIKGSTVDINCTYRYPSRINNVDTAVDETLWFTKGSDNEPVDLRTDSEYASRVQYHFGKSDCTLRITDLRESDSADYKFRFITNQRGGKYTGSPGVTLTATGVRGQSCNRVIYNDISICASRGSSVDISCTYSSYESITSSLWFSPDRSHQWQNPSQLEDLSKDSQYAGRVQLLETKRGRSTLRISDLRDNDSAQYHFTFKTRSFEWRSSLPGITLTVTALQVQVITITVPQSHMEAELKCLSSCSPAGRISYVWFKNGQKTMKEETSVYSGQFNPGDNISCALKGHEDYRSPSVYGPKLPSVSVSPSGEIIEGSSVTLTCSSDANPAANYTWYKENVNPDLQPLSKEPQLVFSPIQSSDSGEYYCTAENQLGKSKSEYIFIDVKYAPKLPSVSVSPSAEIVEGSSVTLTCSSDANPAANYTWYKENEDSPKASGQLFTMTDVRPEHSGNYSCEAQNRRGHCLSSGNFVEELYAPKLPSVSVSPSGEIIEGSSLTLTCSSDANPAANYTWYKKNVNPDLQPLSKEPQLVFSAIQSSNSGEYYCTAENQLGKRKSEYIFIDVKYAPKLPSVSVSPSAEIVEGSSVNLTCSSDANPAANYTWYKENEDSPKASGQIFIITDVRPEHSGNYYCEAQNRRGRHNSTLHLTVVAGTAITITAGVTAAVLLLIIILSVFLWMRKKRASNQSSEAEERPDDREMQEVHDNILYASVQFSNNQADLLYSNIRSDQLHRHMEEQEYAAVNFNRAGTAPRTRGQQTWEDPAALYSTVNKTS
ncbi:B-cell receptor CD22-like [Scomber scombrus]|uniref:B-cell receptor CD22-like n=1 Tax=Scomber scombrus TaxID=13677 RepID=UPI002DD987FB|nr:B-cell receptor CD22-like [Scomber scombrus]